MKKQHSGTFRGILIISVLLILFSLSAFALAEGDRVFLGKGYVLPEDSNYDYSRASVTNRFFYGASSLGTLHLTGNIEESTAYNRHSAFGATGTISIRYAYDGAYKKTDEDSWHIVNDNTHKVRDYDFGLLTSMGNGCIMIEKSTDAVHWEKAVDPNTDWFDKKHSNDESVILTIPEADYMNGVYYRIVVAYKFAKRTHDGFFSDDYTNRKCVEVYEFFLL